LWAAGVTVAAALAGAAYVARGGKDESGRLAAAMQWTLVIWLLVMPAVYPWYAVGLVALSVLRPRWWLVVLSGALALYYVRFLVPYREWDPRAGLAARIVEHGVLWLALIWSAAAARVSAMGRTSTH
jgi:hypothetical protein